MLGGSLSIYQNKSHITLGMPEMRRDVRVKYLFNLGEGAVASGVDLFGYWRVREVVDKF